MSIAPPGVLPRQFLASLMRSRTTIVWSRSGAHTSPRRWQPEISSSFSTYSVALGTSRLFASEMFSVRAVVVLKNRHSVELSPSHRHLGRDAHRQRQATQIGILSRPVRTSSFSDEQVSGTVDAYSLTRQYRRRTSCNDAY